MGDLSIFNLSDYVDKYGCKTYIETGTGQAVCLTYATNYGFNKFYSIDLDGDLIEEAKSKFISNKKVELIHDYSTEGLKYVCSLLPEGESVLFFLDAHFPGADFHKMTYEESMTEFQNQSFPLAEEIKSIKDNRDITNDYFIVDDWKLYDRTKNYEYPEWEYEDVQKRLGLETNGSKIISEFGDTHTHEVSLRHQGFLFLNPKG